MAKTAADTTSTIVVTTGKACAFSAMAPRPNARPMALIATTACTSAPIPSSTDTAYMNGACGQPRMTVVRPWSIRLPAKTPIRQARMQKNSRSRSAPSASSHAATRPVSQRASRSIRRFTPLASPAGMQAATATAKTNAVISLSAVIAVLASQRISTSTTVALATISIPRTPMNAIGRVNATQSFSSRSAIGGRHSGRCDVGHRLESEILVYFPARAAATSARNASSTLAPSGTPFAQSFAIGSSSFFHTISCSVVSVTTESFTRLRDFCHCAWVFSPNFRESSR